MSSAFSATRWVLLGSFGFRIVAYLGQWLILRMVDKELFGAYRGLVDIHLMALTLLPLAIDSLLIREKLYRKRYAIALSQALGALGTMAMLLPLLAVLLPTPGGGSIAARIIEEGATWHAVLVMTPIFAIMALKLSVRSMLAADLKFRQISLGEFGNGVITYLGGALAVWLHPSAASLMIAYLAGEIFECIWLYRGFVFRPFSVLAPSRWKFLFTVLRRHPSFCLTNTADLTLNNIGSLIPGPMILALISAQAAADFQVARMLIQLPILLLVGAIWRVVYPTISGVTEEVLVSRCLRITGTTAAYLVPGVLWLAFFAPVTVWLLGGKDYESAAPLIQWMAVYMGLTAIFSPISALDMIRDKSEWGLYWNIVHTSARIGIIWWAAPQGIVYTIAAMSILSCVLWIVWAIMLGILLRSGLGRFFSSVLKFAPGWLLLGAAFYGCTLLVPTWPIVGLLISAIPGLLYLGVMLKFFPEESSLVLRLAGRGR